MKLASLLFLAPLLYAAIGLGALRLIGAHRDRIELAPLVGLMVAGWVPHVALLLGGVPYFVAATLVLLAIAALPALRDLPRPRVVRSLLRLYLCYAVGVCLFAAAAVPAPGLWGTDWAMYVRASQALLEYAGDPHAFDSLPDVFAARPRLFAARPHLFSTAVAPLTIGVPPLIALELLSCVAGASLLLALGYIARRFGRPEPTGLWIAFFLSLPLFAYHVLTIWPKFMVTAAVGVALADAYAYRSSGRRTDWFSAWVWMGLAVAAHHASALYLPLLLLVAGGRAVRPFLRAAVPAGLALLVTAGVYESWVWAKLGASARIASNPAIYQAERVDPVFLLWKTLRQLFASVVGTGLPYAFRNLSAAAGEPLPIALGHLSYAVSGWLVFLAGTFVGNLLPILCAAPASLAGLWRQARSHELFGPFVLGGAIALIGASVLAPIVHLSAAQLGSTPTCVALVYFASSSLPPPLLRRALVFSLVLGTAPLLCHLVVTRVAFARALSTDPDWLDWFLRFEADSRLLFSLGETTLWQAMSPAVAFAGLALVAIPLLRTMQDSRSP